MNTLYDQFGRRIEYLRISVTDRCNLRCLYCMPLEGLPWIQRAELLTDTELIDIVRQLAELGLRRVRLTGGEPTIRPGLAKLVAAIRAIPEIEDIALSTNGVKFTAMAAELRAAGLDRVNISADSLRPDRVRAIARRSVAFSPIEAAETATEVGLEPVKLNVVVMRGVNDDEVEDFARLTLDRPWHVRFIELMPVGDMRDDTWDRVVPSDELLERFRRLGTLTPSIGPSRGNGPARYYRLGNAAGTVGVITPMSHTYCGSCNRVRLTADGRLRTCLYGDHEVNLREPLRAQIPLEPFVRRALAEKPREHALLEMRVGGLRALSQVGG
jgi:cyclic pyranopterin phosphate synthase